MTEEELEKKAEVHIKKNMVKCIQEQIEYFEFAKYSYIAGAKENGVIWHDLKKNPNDLPKNQNEVLCLLWEDSYYIGYYSTNCEMWCFSEFSLCKDENEGEVTAWCELPNFEVEK